MAIVFDSASTDEGADDLEFEHTVTSLGSNRILVAGISTRYDVGVGVNDIASVTFAGGGVLEKAYLLYADRLQTWLWFMTHPTVGAHNVNIDIDPRFAGTNIAAVVASYTGVNPNDPFGLVYYQQEFVNTVITEAVASQVGELVLAIGGTITATTHTHSAGSTERGETGFGAGGAHVRTSINDEPGAAVVNVGFTANAANARKNLISVALRPAIDFPIPSVEYSIDIWDSEQRVKDSDGHVVPRYRINPNNWIRTIGLGASTAEVYADHYQDPDLAYIESVKYDGETDQVEIITNRGDLPEVILARAASGGTG